MSLKSWMLSGMLASAAIPYHPGRQIAIVGEARRTWKNNVVTVAAVRAAPDVARQLKNEARRAFIMPAESFAPDDLTALNAYLGMLE